MSNIYETGAFSQIQNGSMHPGGLRLTDRAVRLAALTSGMRVADVGCGTGATAAFLSTKYKLSVVGLDISEALIELGKRNNPGLNLLPWDGVSLPFEDGCLDAVLFECTLSVIGNTRHMLARCAKALKYDGALILSDIYAKQRLSAGSAPPFTIEDFIDALTDTGFDIAVQEDHTAALRTYAAELREKNGNNIDACSFFGASCMPENVRLSQLGYLLMIARKT
jgi:ubiquinone/menaquinone biosynthesis C-methylase UbiE